MSQIPNVCLHTSWLSTAAKRRAVQFCTVVRSGCSPSSARARMGFPKTPLVPLTHAPHTRCWDCGAALVLPNRVDTSRGFGQVSHMSSAMQWPLPNLALAIPMSIWAFTETLPTADIDISRSVPSTPAAGAFARMMPGLPLSVRVSLVYLGCGRDLCDTAVHV